MKIRQYTAPTMQEALLKIKLDLGPEAVILHQRTLKKGGFLGFFGKDVVEVLAAVDTSPGERRRKRDGDPREAPPQASIEEPPARPALASGGIGPWDAPPPQTREAVVPAAPAATAPAATAPAATAQSEASSTSATVAQVAEDVKAAVLEQLLSNHVREAVSQAVETAVGDVAQKVEEVVSRLETALPSKGAWTPAQHRVYDLLLKKDLDAALARQILAKLHGQGAHTEGEMADRLPEAIASLLSVSGPIEPPSEGKGPKVVALVGPTGVGKTTTIAKLAATFRLTHNKGVGLITIDTYRIAAVEQLKVYADIIGIPVEVVMTPGNLKEALARLGDRDLVLIDTAGRSPSHKLHLNELKTFLDAVPEREVHLVLAATATRANLLKAIQSFSHVGVDRLVFTKIDEAATLGSVVSAAHASSAPISYLTVGQSVPDDLKQADPLDLARTVLA